MLMRTRLPRRLASAVFVFAVGACAQEITEKEAVRRFLSESPLVRELEAGIEITRAETRGWSLWPNPAAGYSREGAGLTEFVQYQQPLVLSGRLGYLRQAGASAVNAMRLQSGHTRWEWINELRSAFYALVAAQQREAAVRANIAQLDEVVRVLRQREREGEGSTYDRLRAERERSEAETELAASRVSGVQAGSRLAAFFAPATDPSSLIAQGQLGSEASVPPLSELYERAFAARGDYTAEAQQITRFELQERAASRLRIPEPAIAAGLKRGDVGGRIPNGSFVAVSVPLPLFSRGASEVARFRAEAERAESRRQALRQRIQAQVNAAHATAELRRRVLGEYQRALEAQGRQLEQIARTSYQEGELGILELLDAYRVSLQSRLRLIDLSSAAKQAEIELERVVGEPVLSKEVLP